MAIRVCSVHNIDMCTLLFDTCACKLNNIDWFLTLKMFYFFRRKVWSNVCWNLRQILATQIFLRIFEITTPLSHFWFNTTKVNGTFSRDFDSIKCAADRFVKCDKDKLELKGYKIDTNAVFSLRELCWNTKRKKVVLFSVL